MSIEHPLTPDNPYVVAWNCALKGLLGWTPERVDKELIQHWQNFMDEVDSDGMFYHEGPDWYLYPILLQEWRNEAPESVRMPLQNGDFRINITARQEEEVMEPLKLAYRKLDWLHVHEDVSELPNWTEIVEQIKAKIRTLVPYDNNRREAAASQSN